MKGGHHVATRVAETVARRHSHALSVVIPFYAAPESPWLLERLDDLCGHFPKRDDIEFIVADSGSAPRAQERCRQICAGHGVRCISRNERDKVFVIGAGPIRDFGARHARGRLITFCDVDLRVPSYFWGRLLKLISDKDILGTKKSFLAVAATLLTEEATRDLAVSKGKLADFCVEWLHGKMEAEGEEILFSSSMIIIGRLYYLSIGGHQKVFRGRGEEDAELYNRLIEEEGVLPQAGTYRRQKSFWEIYNGILHKFLLLSQPALDAGLLAFHLWHPRTSRHYGRLYARRNVFALRKFIKEFNRDGEHPPPLIDGAVADNRVLFVGDEPEKAPHCLRDIFPILGSPICVSEGEFVDDRGRLSGTKFGSFLRERGISLVLFHDPDKNADRRQLYDWCRGKKLGVLCFGRGVLPNSWFFDENGCGGGSYSASRWDKPLTKEEMRETLDYIKRADGALAEAKKLCAEVSGGAVGTERFHRFVHFLRYEFYSFAELRASTFRAAAPRHSPTAALPPLDFYEMRLPGKPQVVHRQGPRSLPRLSLMLEEYTASLAKNVRSPPRRGPCARLVKESAAVVGFAILDWVLRMRTMVGR